jgi:putative ATP-dependent endonuclease of OLD family
MYLKSLEITNFRKFGSEHNKIEFVDAKSLQEQKKAKDINIAPTTTLIVGKNNCGKTTIVKALEILVSSNVSFKANDFNFYYLEELLQQYKCSFVSKEEENTEVQMPYLKFLMSIGLEDNCDITNGNGKPYKVYGHAK